MSDSEEEVTASKGESLSDFVDILQEHPVVFQKSMLPDTRQRRSAVLSHIKEKYERSFGVGISEDQLYKKLANMKTRLKKKSDRNMTGNKPIILNDWEKKLYNLLTKLQICIIIQYYFLIIPKIVITIITILLQCLREI